MNNVVVTSYEIAMNDSAASSSILWRYIVVDEGHRLKNRNRTETENRTEKLDSLDPSSNPHSFPSQKSKI